LKSEFGKFGLRPIGLFLITDTALLCSAPIQTVADLKGKRIASRGVQSDTLSALGAVPMAMAPPEMYDGLKKGILDAVACPAVAVYDFKLYEGGKYYATFQFGSQVQPVVIREKTWEKLPADIQKMINDSRDDMVRIAYEDFVASDDFVMDVMKENKIEILEVSDADLAAIQKVQAVQVDKWAEELESKGLPAKKLLEEYKALVEKYEKTNPYK
jgi:TRAP-type C4-dicarboxylate transport system substrate-binding protein